MSIRNVVNSCAWLEGEAPAEPRLGSQMRLGRSLALCFLVSDV
jgi:hypothetical protein